MKRTFFCASCQKDHPIELNAGYVSGHRHCKDRIAGARKAQEQRRREKRREQIAADAKKAKSSRVIAISPLKGVVRRKIEIMREQRELEKSLELDYV